MDGIETFLARVDNTHFIAIRFQALFQGFRQLDFVLDHQDAHSEALFYRDRPYGRLDFS